MEIDPERLKSLRQQALADSKRGEREAEQRRRTTLNSDRWNEIHRVMNDLPGMLEDAARRGIDTVEIYHKTGSNEVDDFIFAELKAACARSGLRAKERRGCSTWFCSCRDLVVTLD
jgi:CRISPR/Cas system CMR-associated protein Cmr1 (group 7 of RAMP superfamily)